MKKLFNTSFIYGILGLVFGVFYREFTKFNGFVGVTQLSFLHVHTLVLGMLFFLVVLLLNGVFGLTKNKSFNIWFYLYNIGFIGMLSIMTTRGVLQVLGHNINGLNHIAGLFHAILGSAIVWFMVILGNCIGQISEYNHN